MTDIDQGGFDKTAYRLVKSPTVGIVDTPTALAPPPVPAGGSPGQVQYNNAGALGGLTNAQLTALLNIFTDVLKGIVPASGGGTTNFLRADGSWAIPPGGGGGGGGGISVITPQNYVSNAGTNGGTLCALSDIQDSSRIGIYSTFDTLDSMAIQEAIFACFASASPTAPANGINVTTGGPSGGLTIAASANTVGGVLGGSGTYRYYYDYPNAWYVQQLAESRTTAGPYGGITFNAANRPAAGFFLQFDFREGPVVITEAKWFQDNSDSYGTFQWQGWNGVSWINIGGTFTLGGTTTQTQTQLNGNVTAYGSYRLLGISGTITGGTSTIAGIQFKQGGSYITTNRSSTLTWNAPSNTQLNKTFYNPIGRYNINRQILTVAQNAEIWFQSKNDSRWIWTGDRNTSMWVCDSLAYARVFNPSFAISNNGGTFEPFWDLTGSGVFGGLKTQQITIYDMVSNGINNISCPYGIAISRAGNSAQGDTICIINPFIGNHNRAGILVNGQNALSVQVVNGDIQTCLKNGIQVNGGSLFCFGTSFQNEMNNFFTTIPMRNQIRNGGYDFACFGGAGGSVTNRIMEARSESDCVAFNSGNNLTISGGGNTGSSQTDWFAGTGFPLGSIIFPNANNTKNRAFMLVDAGGPPDDYPYGWHDINFAASDSTHVQDAGSPGWSVNQWAGYTCGVRFGNSFPDYSATILSNTANRLTLDTAVLDTSNLSMTYAIVGASGGSAPNFDSVQDSTVLFNFSGVFPWSVTQNSNVLNTPSGGFNTSDFSGDGGATWTGAVLLSGEADQYGKTDSSDGYIQTGLIARIIGTPGANQWTMNRNAGLSANSTGPAYGGRVLADGTQGLKWMHIPFPITLDAVAEGFNPGGGGRVYDGPTAEAINMGNIPTNQLGLSSGFQYGSNSGGARNFNIKLANDLYNAQFVTITTNPQGLGTFQNSDTYIVTVSATGTITCTPDTNLTNVQLTRRLTVIWKGAFAGTITLGSGFRALASPALTFTGANQMFCSEFVLISLFGTAQWVEISRVGPS